MNEYQSEQFETFDMVQKLMSGLSVQEKNHLKAMISDYLGFRKQTAEFLKTHFSKTCTLKCYQNYLSACCSREGIITFFADIIINVLISNAEDIDVLLKVLKMPNTGYKCVYLGNNGCRWKMKPIVCEMFLCDSAKKKVFDGDPDSKAAWESLKKQEKHFTWPDRPVLFDMLEEYFLDAGCSSPLMYLHNSPGLLRVKQNAQIQQETNVNKAMIKGEM